MSIGLSTAKWFKSSRSGTGQDCVEVAHLAEGKVGIRDSKNPGGPALLFAPGEWDAFTSDIQRGQLDLPS